MSGPVGSQHWMYASGGFYDFTIDQSLRCDGSTSYLNFTPTANAATDSSKMTFSTWVKTWGFGLSDGYILSAGSSNIDGVGYPNTDKFAFVRAGVTRVTGNAVRRDPSAWYHLYVTYEADGDQKVRIYVNGVLDNEAAQTTDLGKLGVQNQLQRLVRKSNASTYLDLYLAETHFVDGSIVPISTFGETKNGVWVPVQTSGITYGNNGWYLDYADTSDIGKDVSGRGNHWTANGLAATDVVPDSPTNNFCTLNPLAYSTLGTLSEGNLKIATSTNNRGIHGTMPIPTSGKWYWELHVDSFSSGGGVYVGFGSDASLGYDEYASTKGVFMSTYNQAVDVNGSTQSSPYNSQGNNSTSNGDIYSFALDVDNQKFYVAKNGTYRGSSDPSAGSGGLDVSAVFTNAVTDITVCLTRGGSYNETYSLNFGQDSKDVASANADENGIGTFEYAVPTGFLALCASNLPEPTIGANSNTQSDDYFNTVLYTGNSSTNAITGVGFQPDWVWIKNRTDVVDHVLTDAVRGATIRLESNSTDTETTQTEDLQSFDADGFTVGNQNRVNGSSDAMVAWNWKAGGSSNTFNIDGTGYADMSSAGLTDGTIALSGLSANTTSGFSVATFTMTSGNSTLAHGLGTEPDLLIFKRRAGSASSWVVWARPFGENTKSNLLLDGTAAAGSSGSGNWIQNITNTLVGIGDYGNMAAAGTHVMYAFASVDGHSKVGSYIGNGNADGTFVYTGFRPAWVMVRRSSSTGGWHIFDNKRPNAYNEIDKRLEADNTDAENSTSGCEIDLVSNGFKFRGTFDNINGNGNTHIYLAFAEAPFKYANAR